MAYNKIWAHHQIEKSENSDRLLTPWVSVHEPQVHVGTAESSVLQKRNFPYLGEQICSFFLAMNRRGSFALFALFSGTPITNFFVSCLSHFVSAPMFALNQNFAKKVSCLFGCCCYCYEAKQ